MLIIIVSEYDSDNQVWWAESDLEELKKNKSSAAQ